LWCLIAIKNYNLFKKDHACSKDKEIMINSIRQFSSIFILMDMSLVKVFCHFNCMLMHNIRIIKLFFGNVSVSKNNRFLRVFGSALASAFFIKLNNIMFGYLQQLCFGHGTHENLMFHRRFCASNFFMLLAMFFF